MVAYQSAVLVAADCLRSPKNQYRLLQTVVRQSPTDKRLPAPFLRPTSCREVFGACSKYLSTTSWSQRRRRNPQKPLVIVSDHRTVVADHQKTTEDHQLFGGRSWSLVVGRPCVTGVLSCKLSLGYKWCHHLATSGEPNNHSRIKCRHLANTVHSFTKIN